MSLSVRSPWQDDAKLNADHELRLCLDRGSDSDDQSELNRSLSELIESITCKDDSGDDSCSGGGDGGGRESVADIVECLLDRVEAAASAPGVDPPDAREIDLERSRDKKFRHAAKKAERRKRDRDDHESRKLRRRSTSCSTTSSACSDISRKHRRKHKHRRRDVVDDPSPRVNPIFLWVKQDDTRIVEVRCEDYDKRNRIRLTKTAQGWRAIPRTERLDSTLSKSSVDMSPTTERPPSLASPSVNQDPHNSPQTKENNVKRCVKRKSKSKKKRCDKKNEDGFKNENNYLDEYCNVDVVNNNSCSVSNNNNKVNDDKQAEPNLLEPRLRSFGYKKACHEDSKVEIGQKMIDNKASDEIDIYTFVPTPKTNENKDEEDNSPLVSENLHKLDLNIKNELDPTVERLGDKCELVSSSQSVYVKPDILEEKCLEKSPEVDLPDTVNSVNNSIHFSNEQCQSDKAQAVLVDLNDENDKNGEDKCQLDEAQIELKPNIRSMTLETEPEELKPSILSSQSQDETTFGHTTELRSENQVDKPPINLQSKLEFIKKEPLFDDNKPSELTTVDDLSDVNSCNLDVNGRTKDQIGDDNEVAHDEEDDQPSEEVILPELHLQTPEPSPEPVPEPSSVEPEMIMSNISLHPDTSLDSDAIHLPDTTTKSETSLLIKTDISLGQKLNIKPDSSVTVDSSMLSAPSPSDKSSHDESDISRHHQSEDKDAVDHQTEIERQISADLDEDHLLAIEEILQGEECVGVFDDDDLPEEYPVSHESPVNLSSDFKSKEPVDNSGIPLSLRTDDFLEIFPTSCSMKEHADVISIPSLFTKKQVQLEKAIPPAHQQSKTKFLETILACPKRSHDNTSSKVRSPDQQEPLYLGVSRKSASPTVSSSDGRKFSSPELEPKPKRMKVEDITLKAILNKNRESYTKSKSNKVKESDEVQQTADSTTKSRLLELLTNESDEHNTKLDPLTQLKEVLSDPDLNVPDPLLVPRARLSALVANPAKEIPRLLAMKAESLAYPKLLTDPDLLVVSLSHLQGILQASGKDEEILRYQQQAQLLQQQMKQEHASLDAATATALNQMMWLPYLSQLEAAAMACGNTQDFMAMLNMVFPSGTYPQMNPYMMSSPSTGINAYDYKSQLEFQQAFAAWNEVMMQAATNQFAAQTLGTTANKASNNYQNYTEPKYNLKSHSNSTGKYQDLKHTAARTSPITLNYQQSKHRVSQYPYTSMFSIPTSTPPTTTTTSTSNCTQYRTSQSTQSQQSYHNRQRNYSSYNYSSLRPPSLSPSVPKMEPLASISAIPSDMYKSQRQPSASSCRSLMNILSKPKQTEAKSHVAKAYPTSTTMLTKETSIRLAPAPAAAPAPSPAPRQQQTHQEPPKLKVKQPQHLVDPNLRPKLLNFDEHHGEVGSTTGSLAAHVDESHPNLWHPLFSSHQQKSYTSPWQWTTPVTVSGE